MKKYYFTMIVYVDSDETLNRTLKSIFNALKTTQEMTKLIIVDAVCSETSKKIVNIWEEKLGKENIVYISTEGQSVSEAYNVAIPEIRGKYVNFSMASTWFDPGTLDEVLHIAEEREHPKLISLSPWTVNEKNESLQYRISPKPTGNKYENIRFYRKPEKLQLMFNAYFIRTFLINDKERTRFFRPELQGDAVMEMLLELLAEWRGYVYIPNLKFHYTLQLEDNTSAFLDQHYAWWYTDAFETWILPFAEKWSEKNWPLEIFIQTALLYLVYARYNCNYNNRNKGVLTGENLETFYALTGRILQYIGNDIIFRRGKRSFVIPRTMRMFFLRLKAKQAGCNTEIVTMEHKLYLWIYKDGGLPADDALKTLKASCPPPKELLDAQKKVLSCNETFFTVRREDRTIPTLSIAYQNTSLLQLCDVNTEHVILHAINYRDGMLEIDGAFSGGDFLDRNQIKLELHRNEMVIPIEYSEIYGLNQLFGRTYNHKYQFHVSVVAHPLGGESIMQFVLVVDDEQHILEIRNGSVYAHVREDIFGQYWKYCEGYSINIAKKTNLIVRTMTAKQEVKKETVYRDELRKRGKGGDEAAIKALSLREQYFKQKKELGNRRIWITFDKLYKAGDNGEYMYDYISAQQDGVEIYYLIKEDSPDYKRLQGQEAHLLTWGKDETLVTVLLAEAILTTHTNVVSYTGFDKKLVPYICDLFNPINICIQHGLTVQNIAQFQNRLFDNLQLYLCISPKEIENLSRPIYGYIDKNSLKLAGIARYDGLENNSKKQILITPTWRRNIANSNIAHFKKGHNDFFKNSTYYDVYNRLINDEKLIATAKKYNYRIIYLLHPAASAQINDFDQNEYVELLSAAEDINYEKILTESSLMVTDYSGVQFDFAYMRKPILYYHPNSLPPHYDESEAYRYDTDAFGPVIDNQNELVNALCEYMKNKCVMHKEYVERADRFFAYNDYSNRERIFQEIMRFLKEYREGQSKY